MKHTRYVRDVQKVLVLRCTLDLTHVQMMNPHRLQTLKMPLHSIQNVWMRALTNLLLLHSRHTPTVRHVTSKFPTLMESLKIAQPFWKWNRKMSRLSFEELKLLKVLKGIDLHFPISRLFCQCHMKKLEKPILIFAT